MGVDLKKIRRKASDPRSKSLTIETINQERTISKPKVAVPTGVEAEADSKINHCIACFLESKKMMAQKPNQLSPSTTTKEVNHTSHRNERSQSSSLTQPSPKLHPSSRIPHQLPQISFAILPAIQLYTTSKANPHTIANNHQSSYTPANNISNHRLTNTSTKSRAKQCTSTSATKPRIFPARNKLSNLRYN
jgi:hypothetical protein